MPAGLAIAFIVLGIFILVVIVTVIVCHRKQEDESSDIHQLLLKNNRKKPNVHLSNEKDKHGDKESVEGQSNQVEKDDRNKQSRKEKDKAQEHHDVYVVEYFGFCDGGGSGCGGGGCGGD